MERVPYFTPAGELELVPATQVTAIRLPAGAVAEAVSLGEDAGEVVVLDAAEATPGVDRLPVFFTTRGFGPLIADERIRARFVDLAAAEVELLARSLGASGVRPIRPELGIYEVLAPTPAQTVELAAQLHRQPQVAWAHPDFVMPITDEAAPDDSLAADQWHLGLLGATAAWQTTRGSAEVRIAVLDTGIDPTHPDLAAKIVDARDTLDGDDDARADADAPHGTACAGLAAAETDNGTGVAGLCPECLLVPIRVADSGMTRTGSLADAFYWATDHGARIIANSWYVPLSYDLETAIRFAATEAFAGGGALVLFAAGNDGAAVPADSPAMLETVLAVGASNPFDVRAGYSNVGAALDLVAPAASVTTDLQGQPGYSAGDYAVDFGGTSAATPVAAGVAALLLSRDPTLTAAQLAALLRGSAVAIDARVSAYVDGRNDEYGWGRIDPVAALAMLDAGLGHACDSAASCGPGGACLAAIGGQGRPRACTLACSSDADCPAALACRATADSGGACLPACSINLDCVAESACWPDENGAGFCLRACSYDSDCDEGGCNDLGLCGDLAPPGQGIFEPLLGFTGCAGVSPRWLALAGLVLLRRRRR